MLLFLASGYRALISLSFVFIFGDRFKVALGQYNIGVLELYVL